MMAFRYEGKQDRAWHVSESLGRQETQISKY